MDKLIRLEGGERNQVYKAQKADWVVRVYQPSAPLDGIRFEHGLMGILSTHMDSVVKPLSFGRGETYFIWEGRPVAVLPYLNGTKPTRADSEDPAFCYKAGHLLGMIHRIGAENAGQLPRLSSRIPLIRMDPYQNHMYDWEKACQWLRSTKFSSEIAYIKTTLEALWDFIQTQEGNPLIPIHGDYYIGNLLWDGRDITGVIDFDDARNEWVEDEVARSLWEFARNDRLLTFHDARRRAYLEGYSSAFPQAKHDMSVYVKLNRLERLLEILSTATSMVTGDHLNDWYDDEEDYQWRNLLWCKESG